MIINLLKTSLLMSATVVVLMILTRVFSRPALARWRYICWVAIALGLLIPFRVPVLSIEQPEVLTQIESFAAGNAPLIGVNTAGASGNDMTDAIENARRQSMYSPNTSGTVIQDSAVSINPGTLLLIVWAAGCLGFVTMCVVRHIRFMRHIRRWGSVVSDQRIKLLLEEASNTVGLKRRVSVCVCGAVDTPVMTGFIRPLIVIPQTSEDDDTLRLILAHELIHYKRGDIWTRTLMLAAWAVHWFNPVMFVMNKAMNREREIACDQNVLCRFGSEHREKYGQAVFNTAYNAAGSGRNSAIVSPAFSDGARHLKARLTSIFEHRSMKRWVAVCCALALVSATMFSVLLTGCESEQLAPEIADAPVDLTPTNELVMYMSFLNEYYLSPLIERYKIMYPDVNVITEVMEGMDGYANRMSVELPAGKGTDIVFPGLMWYSDINKLANSGAFLDMKTIIKDDKDFNMDNYVKAAFDGGIFRGRQYLVPLSYTVGGYLSSTPKIKEIGFDMSKSGDMVSFINELVRCAPKASENPDFQSVLVNDSFYNLVAESGLMLVDFAHNKALPDEANLKKFLEAYKQYFPYDKQESDTTDVIVALQSGRRYFEYEFDTNSYLDLAEMLKSSGGYETSVPHGMDGKLQGWSYNSVAIRSGSKNQLNAWNFIKLLLSPECQMPESGIFNLVGYPVLKDAVSYVADVHNSQLQTPLSTEETQAFVDLILNVDSCDLYPIKSADAIRKHMEPWFKDEKSYDECLEALRNELTLYLSE